MRFLDQTYTHTLNRIPVNEWSAYRRGCCLHNKHETNTYALSRIQTHNPSKRAAQTYALDCMATRIGPVPVPTYKTWTYNHVSDGIWTHDPSVWATVHAIDWILNYLVCKYLPVWILGFLWCDAISLIDRYECFGEAGCFHFQGRKFFYPEDRGSTFLLNFGAHLPTHSVSCPRKV